MDLLDIEDETLKQEIEQALAPLAKKYGCKFDFRGDCRQANPTKRKFMLDMIVENTKEQQIEQYKKNFYNLVQHINKHNWVATDTIIAKQAAKNITNLDKYFTCVYTLGKYAEMFNVKPDEPVRFIGYKTNGHGTYLFQKVKTGKLLTKNNYIMTGCAMKDLSDILENQKVQNENKSWIKI